LEGSTMHNTFSLTFCAQKLKKRQITVLGYKKG